MAPGQSAPTFELVKDMDKPEPLDELTIPPKDFGDGWLTDSAQDLCKIAIAFGGFSPWEIILAVHKIQRHGRNMKANVVTVGKALQMVYEAHETPEQRAERAAAYAALKAKLNETR